MWRLVRILLRHVRGSNAVSRKTVFIRRSETRTGALMSQPHNSNSAAQKSTVPPRLNRANVGMMRGIRLGFGSSVLLSAVGLFAVLSACSSDGGGKNAALNRCIKCAEEKCPSQSEACDKLPACQTLRSCELGCAQGDSACQNECVKAAANDSSAIVAAANLVACASTSCSSACSEASNSGSGGQGSTSQGGKTSTTGGTGVFTGGTTSTGTGGTASPPLQCKDLIQWSAACVVSNDVPFRTCETAPPSLCQTGCYLDASCDEYSEFKAGAMNSLWTCLKACDLAGGATVPVTCANAKAKWVLCGNNVSPACNDADAVDQCFNKCVLTYPCDQWEPPMGQPPTAFQNCYNGCEASVGTSSPNFVVSEGGYVETTTWHGYAWTATDGKSATTISPADFSTLPAGRQLCASGTVAGTADYSAVAMLGFNLAQEKAPPGTTAPAPTSWSPADTIGNGGVFYGITNRTSTPLRIQIQGPTGNTDPNQRWCADVDGQNGSIFWHTFNTQCWEGGLGTAYNGVAALTSMMVLVPGDTTARSFDFCIYEILKDD